MTRLIRQAFTLIELLVVIAIIGILSGLIVVSMGNITQKATIAKAQVFSNSLRNSLMLNLTAEWKFDGSGVDDGNIATTAYTQDSWGGVNNCTIAGTPFVYSGSNCVNGSCLQFNGSTDYLNCGSNVAIGLNSFTFSFWAKTSISGVSQTVIRRLASTTGWVGEISLPYTLTRNLLFYVTTSTYSGSSIFQYMSPYDDNSNTTDDNWHFFVASCDRSKHEPPNVYLDGVLKNGYPTGYCDLLTDNIPAGILTIGFGSRGYFNGFLDEIRAYNAAMPISQIQQQYYVGLNRLLANGNIGIDEYNQRIKEISYK
jgi:prepilin-type N-terminal cleavage/methylation domain-containing protein